MSDNNETNCNKDKQDKCQSVSAWPSVDEALSMTKKLFSDTAKSISEIYGDYKHKRATSDADLGSKKTDNPAE